MLRFLVGAAAGDQFIKTIPFKTFIKGSASAGMTGENYLLFFCFCWGSV